jgi:VWFA-related protein
MAAVAALWLGVDPAAQQPTFRSAVDLIAVDAQVVSGDGTPIDALAASAFDVSVGGRRRRVVSADFVRVERPDASLPFRPLPPIAPGGSEFSASRTFIVAVDQSSFDIGAAKAPLEAAREFVSALSDLDHVGLYVFPNGPRVAPGDGRALVRQALSTVTGNKVRFGGQYHLRPAEIVDITGVIGGANSGGFAARVRTSQLTAAQIDANPVYGVQARECPDDPECGSRILNEAQAMALHLEGQATRSLQGLEALLDSLVDIPGRKTVVLVTAGLVVSDRPGGRPDVGDLSRVLGQRAASANAVVYTIHADSTAESLFSATRRRVGDIERDRDRSMSGDWLDNFSAAAGGLRIHVPVGTGDYAFDRVLRETSGYYVLGVEPTVADRDGRPRELRVRVSKSGATVRARQWVVVPKT